MIVYEKKIIMISLIITPHFKRRPLKNILFFRFKFQTHKKIH